MLPGLQQKVLRTFRVLSQPRKIFAVLVVFTVTLLTFGATTTPAGADTEQSYLAFRSIDASRANVISANITWSGQSSQIQDARVAVNGNQVDADITPRGENTQQAIAFIVDTSKPAQTSGLLEISKAWLKQWVEQRTSPDQWRGQPVAIYAAGATPQLLQDYTSDPERVLRAIERLNGKVGATLQDSENTRSSLWETVKTAADRVQAYPIEQRNIVIFTAAGNTTQQDYTGAAAGFVISSKAALFAVVGPETVSSSRMDSLVSQTGGVAISVLNSSEIQQAANQISDIISKGQYRVVIDYESEDSVLVIDVAVGGIETSGIILNGSTVTGTSALSVDISGPGDVSFYLNPIVLIVALVLIAVAIGGIIYTVVNNIFSGYSFSQQIASYQNYRENYGDLNQEVDPEQSALGTTKSFIVQKALEATERVAEERGILNRVDSALERASINIKPAEFLILYLAGLVVFPVLGFFLGGLLFFLIFAFLAVVGPLALLSNLAERRRRKFLAQLPDSLHLLAGSLRAGYSLMQGVEAVSEETPDPMAQELRRVITETRLGGDLIESLDKVALRMNSQDFAWVVMGVSIQSEVGGDLAELLDTVADTMVQRERLRRDIKSLTAEGRISALVLTLLPVALLVILNVVNPSYGENLLTTGTGQFMLLFGGMMLGVGWFWMKKIVDIKV